MKTSMMLLAVLVLLVALITVQSQELSPAINESISVPTIDPIPNDAKIVGGYACAIRNVNYQLSLQQNNRQLCGASLITTRWAVTAAHCVVDYPASVLSLRAGSSSSTTGGVNKRVALKISHPSYNPITADYDIAVLKVSSAYVLSATIGVVSLHRAGATIAGGINVVVSGWGRTSQFSPASTILRCVNVPTVTTSVCQPIWWKAERKIITPRMVCAGGLRLGGKGSCRGDSGGPMVQKVGTSSVLIGVVSWGNPCAKPTFPDVYARISALNTWIVSKISATG